MHLKCVTTWPNIYLLVRQNDLPRYRCIWITTGSPTQGQTVLCRLIGRRGKTDCKERQSERG